MKREISPTNDFLFKCLFGRVGSEDLLLSFLNAIRENCHEQPFESIKIIPNKELPKQKIDGKMSIIDIRATLPDQTTINIEIQLKNQKNMDKRTLYYWSKLYIDEFNEGQKYHELTPVVTINIIDFDYFKEMKYHNRFKILNVEPPHQMLTEDLEIHFIQLPKYRGLKEKDYQKNSLHRWLTFLEKEIPDQLLKELIDMDANLKVANEKLETLLADDETKALAWERERAIIEYNSQIDSAREEGREEEREKALLEKFQSAKTLLANNFPIEVISQALGLSIEEIEDNVKK